MSKPRIISPNKVYHVYGNGAFELILFRDENDKVYFINLLEEKSFKYNFTIHAFVIMDTHYHFSGLDNDSNLSIMMQSILTSYAMYYNKKYLRRGHVFRERFRSRPIKDSYDLINITKYIHNNPKDIEGFAGLEETFKYSSVSKYTDKENVLNKFVDITCVMNIVSITDIEIFKKSYLKYLKE